MLAALAVIVFVVGLVLRLVEATDSWIWLFLGLALLAAHHAWATDGPWRRRV